MLKEEIKKKIRLIQIHARKVLSGNLIGDYTTAIKGTGTEFDQIREYQQGDDVRFIDWKSSARSGKLLVKQYFEERDRAIIIVVDISASLFFSSNSEFKYEIAAQIASVLAIAGYYSKDKVGLVLFNDQVIKFIPPKLGYSHSYYIMENLFGIEKSNGATDIKVALEFVSKNIKKKSIVFLISDFITDKDFQKSLKIVANNFDLIAVRCIDNLEKKLPESVFLNLNDIESGKESTVNMNHYSNLILAKRVDDQNKLFKKNKIDFIDINVRNKNFVNDIVLFFKNRMVF